MASGGESRPGDALLCCGDEIRPTIVGERDRETTDLADGLCGSGEQLGAVAHDPPRAPPAPGLFIGEEREDEVASRHHAITTVGAGDRQDDARIVLHVDGAPPVQDAVVDLRAEWWM